jgi:hypothetical protein
MDQTFARILMDAEASYNRVLAAVESLSIETLATNPTLAALADAVYVHDHTAYIKFEDLLGEKYGIDPDTDNDEALLEALSKTEKDLGKIAGELFSIQDEDLDNALLYVRLAVLTAFYDSGIESGLQPADILADDCAGELWDELIVTFEIREEWLGEYLALSTSVARAGSPEAVIH